MKAVTDQGQKMNEKQTGDAQVVISNSKFIKLYNLALSIITAPVDSPYYKLTGHHFTNQQLAEEWLQKLILQQTAFEDNSPLQWKIVKLFLNNLVNRAHPPMPAQQLSEIIKLVELHHQSYEDCKNQIYEDLKNYKKIFASLDAFLYQFEASENSVNWVVNRLKFYQNLKVQDIDYDTIFKDISAMTKIPNIGIPLAANFFADLNAFAFVKPDLHIIAIMAGMEGKFKVSHKECIRKMIEWAKVETLLIKNFPDFDWLGGEVYPRYLDRVIYLIGSDNFSTNGLRKKWYAPARRKLMLEELNK